MVSEIKKVKDYSDEINAFDWTSSSLNEYCRLVKTGITIVDDSRDLDIRKNSILLACGAAVRLVQRFHEPKFFNTFKAKLNEFSLDPALNENERMMMKQMYTSVLAVENKSQEIIDPIECRL